MNIIRSKPSQKTNSSRCVARTILESAEGESTRPFVFFATNGKPAILITLPGQEPGVQYGVELTARDLEVIATCIAEAQAADAAPRMVDYRN